MDGLGNKFLIIDRRKNFYDLNKDKIINLAKKGVCPFDQLITLEKVDNQIYPIKIYNSDGIETSACGNGVRCVAYLISQEIMKSQIVIKTSERLLNAEILDKQLVKINMGKARFNWDEIPLIKKMNTEQLDIEFLNNKYGAGFCVNVGNPHIIFFVKDCEKVDIKKIGPKIENYKYFPKRINVTFAQIVSKNIIKVNVWERGAGQTKACGTAACAVTVAAFKKKLIDPNKDSTISFRHGNLYVSYKENILMTGSVSRIENINLKL